MPTPYIKNTRAFCKLSTRTQSVDHRSIQEIQLSSDGKTALLFTSAALNGDEGDILFMCEKIDGRWMQHAYFPYGADMTVRLTTLSGDGKTAVVSVFHPAIGTACDIYENRQQGGWVLVDEINTPDRDKKFGHKIGLDHTGDTLFIAAPLNWNQSKFVDINRTPSHRLFENAQRPALDGHYGVIYIYVREVTGFWVLKYEQRGPCVEKDPTGVSLYNAIQFAKMVSMDAAGRRLLVSQKRFEKDAMCRVYCRTVTGWVESNTAPSGACGVLSGDGVSAITAHYATIPTTPVALHHVSYNHHCFVDGEWEFDRCVTTDDYHFALDSTIFQFAQFSRDGGTLAIAETNSAQTRVFLYSVKNQELLAVYKSKTIFYSAGKNHSRARTVVFAFDNHADTVFILHRETRNDAYILTELNRDV